MIQFDPFICDHAAFLIGRRPWDVSRDPEMLFEAHKKAIVRYGFKTCIAGIDIYNAEAEALGCLVEEPEGNNSPAISRPLYASLDKIQDLAFDPGKAGRLPMILETAARLKKAFPECDVRIPVCGPFSLAGHLLGIENLLYEAVSNTEKAGEKLLYLADILIRYVRAICDRKLRVTIFESTAAPPLLSPPLFEALAAPALRRIFDAYLSAMPECPALVIGGNTLPIVGSLLALKPSFMVCPIETDQQEFMRKIKNANGIRTRVAMDSAVFLDITPEKALTDARRASVLAGSGKNTSVGLLLPYAANPAIVAAVNDFVVTYAHAQADGR